METLNALLAVFERYRMEPTIDDVYESVGKQKLYDKMATYVSLWLPIPFIMLGFPFKSTNTRDKVLGYKADMAEQLTLENFGMFDRDIREVYPPGVQITIASDGFVFNKLMGIEDSTVEEYKEMCVDMGRVAPMIWYDLRDFYTKSIPDSREKVLKQFGITPEQLTADILTNPDVNFLYKGMIIFSGEENAMKEWASHNQKQKESKKLAREMMMMNEAYSNLINKEFPNHIRLSMHKSINSGSKYSFQLIKGSAKYSAWHSAALLAQDGWTTIHKKDAVEAGHELIFNNNQPFYFKSANI